jgi:hypothetical protein
MQAMSLVNAFNTNISERGGQVEIKNYFKYSCKRSDKRPFFALLDLKVGKKAISERSLYRVSVQG